ncbi:hypothetical protein DID75_04215 [Candidatus Marinamargulisbacteria bacterium SCGC AG-410-N11]|nr:hypothetical protein DID75_04215 [Candidatus Marinamargulisbacteria bacterium SCGC AG-410-N11]
MRKIIALHTHLAAQVEYEEIFKNMTDYANLVRNWPMSMDPVEKGDKDSTLSSTYGEITSGSLARVLFEVRALLKDNAMFIDIGAGNGHVLHKVCSAFNCSQVIGVDFVEKYVENYNYVHSRLLNQEYQWMSDHPFKTDIRNVQYYKGSFENFLLHHFPKKIQDVNNVVMLSLDLCFGRGQQKLVEHMSLNHWPFNVWMSCITPEKIKTWGYEGHLNLVKRIPVKLIGSQTGFSVYLYTPKKSVRLPLHEMTFFNPEEKTKTSLPVVINENLLEVDSPTSVLEDLDENRPEIEFWSILVKQLNLHLQNIIRIETGNRGSIPSRLSGLVDYLERNNIAINMADNPILMKEILMIFNKLYKDFGKRTISSEELQPNITQKVTVSSNPSYYKVQSYSKKIYTRAHKNLVDKLSESIDRTDGFHSKFNIQLNPRNINQCTNLLNRLLSIIVVNSNPNQVSSMMQVGSNEQKENPTSILLGKRKRVKPTLHKNPILNEAKQLWLMANSHQSFKRLRISNSLPSLENSVSISYKTISRYIEPYFEKVISDLSVQLISTDDQAVHYNTLVLLYNLTSKCELTQKIAGQNKILTDYLIRTINSSNDQLNIESLYVLMNLFESNNNLDLKQYYDVLLQSVITLCSQSYSHSISEDALNLLDILSKAAVEHNYQINLRHSDNIIQKIDNTLPKLSMQQQKRFIQTMKHLSMIKTR